MHSQKKREVRPDGDLMAHFTFALAELAKADVVVMMPNCNDSDICVLEHETAVRCGLPIYYL